MTLDQMGANEWLIVFGAVLGPIAAVQVQKLVERLNEGENRRERAFLTLMGTRQSRLSADHVRALNSIDLAFYDTGWWFIRWRPRKFQEVLDSWNTYREHLNPQALPDDDAAHIQFNATAQQLFLNLLEKLAAATGYQFKRHDLQSGSYSPQAHSFIEQQNAEIRDKVLDMLSGRSPLPMDVRAFPNDPAATERILAGQQALVDAINRFADAAAVTARDAGVARAGNPARPGVGDDR